MTGVTSVIRSGAFVARFSNVGVRRSKAQRTRTAMRYVSEVLWAVRLQHSPLTGLHKLVQTRTKTASACNASRLPNRKSLET